jgi:hypothetical protein
MDKNTAIKFLQQVIFERFPPGPQRAWLEWLDEFAHAENHLDMPTEDPMAFRGCGKTPSRDH